MNSLVLIHCNGGSVPNDQGARKKVLEGVFTNIDVWEHKNLLCHYNKMWPINCNSGWLLG
jgi:hypothetical protein